MEEIAPAFDTWEAVITAFRVDWYSSHPASEHFVGNFSSFLPSSSCWMPLSVLHRLDVANALCSDAEIEQNPEPAALPLHVLPRYGTSNVVLCSSSWGGAGHKRLQLHKRSTENAFFLAGYIPKVATNSFLTKVL